MKAIILAAGYATRLYPLTKNRPKALLEVAGKPVLEHIFDKLDKVTIVDQVIVVSNDRFIDQFRDWKEKYQNLKPIHILNDGTTSNDNRLGAIADLQLAVKEYGICEDIIVLAGDTIFDFELSDFVYFYHEVNADCICVNQLDDAAALSRSGVVELDQNNKVISFEEKPEHPKSNLAVPPFYIYQADTISLIDQYLTEGNNPDAPGNFIPWLIKHKDVYAYRFTEDWYDVGTLEIYEKVKKLFSSRG
ncbi:MAG: nucleotidyltransferase family protein [Firmicutes bacterium]|nr:nucleotidyltransferase family protein [Bacillota bacterium]